MSNPLQTYTNSGLASGGVLNVSWTTPPTVGNTIIVAVYAWFPYGCPTAIVATDSASGNNVYTQIASQSSLLSSGGTDMLRVWSAPVRSNSGFSVSINMGGLPVSFYLKPYYAIVCYECSNLASVQPDTTPTYQTSGGSTLALPFQTPTQSNDFAVALMSVDAQSVTWTDPTFWTVGIENQSSTQPVSGSIVCQQESSMSPVAPAWHSISATTAIQQGALVLFRGASNSLTVSMSGMLADNGMLPPTMASSEIVKPPGLLSEIGMLPPKLSMVSWFAVPMGLDCGLLPPTVKTTGTVTVATTGAMLDDCGFLPMSIQFSQPHLQFKRGTYTDFVNDGITLESGEPFVARQVVSGRSYQSLWLGSVEGVNYLAAGFGGFINGGPPAWVPQEDGIWLVETGSGAGTIYISHSGAWLTN